MQPGPSGIKLRKAKKKGLFKERWESFTINGPEGGAGLCTEEVWGRWEVPSFWRVLGLSEGVVLWEGTLPGGPPQSERS